MSHPFTPTTMHKGGKVQVADTRDDYQTLLWEGWTPDEPAPLPPAFSARQQADLEGGFARRSYRHSGQALRDKLATNQPATWVHIGDSTANGTDEWLRLALDQFRLDYPNLRVTHELWNDTAQGYDAASVLQAGNGGPAPAPVLKDTFTRSGALAGSAADTGQTWTAGNGTLDGSTYTVGSVEGKIAHNIDPSRTEGLRVSARIILPAGIAGGVNSRVYVASNPTGTDEIFAEVNTQAPTNTGITTMLYLRVGGSATSISGSNLTGVPNNSGERIVDVEVVMKDGVVTASFTCGSSTSSRSGSLPAAGWAGYASSSQVVRLTSPSGTGVKYDNLEVGLPAPAPTTFRVINGSMPGMNTAYFQARHELMVPVAPDLLTFASSHNHGTEAVTPFLAGVTTFIGTILDRYPDAGVAISSQNPQFDPKPAASAAAHNQRIAALNAFAASKGWGYIAAAEPFLKRADRGKAWVISDGIHPDAANGSPAWRDAGLAYLRGTRPHYS